jgi:hypothetical protein
MYNDVKKQHYVWEFYLKAWSFEGNKVWCRRNDKIFNTSTENVAQERRFYEITPLTEDEIGFIEAAIQECPQENQLLLKEKLHYLNDISLHSENSRRNALESEYADMEQRCGPILESIRNGSLNVLNNPLYKIIFSIFVGMQYTRTPKCRQGKLNCIPEDKFRLSENFVFYWTYVLFSDAIGSWVSDSKISLLKNETKIPFITGDQPVINLNFSEIQLYYPTSPKLALLFDNKDSKNKIVSTKDVSFFNMKIKEMSENLLIANQKDVLEYI